MFGSKFESQDSNGVDEDAPSQSEDDSIRYAPSFSFLNQEELERLRGGRGLDARRCSKFQSVSASISDPASGGLDTSHEDEEDVLVEVIFEGEKVGGLELELAREKEREVVEDVEAREECLEDVTRLGQCSLERTSPHICATSPRQSLTSSPVDPEELERLRGCRDPDISKMFDSKFKKRNNGLRAQKAMQCFCRYALLCYPCRYA
ncbi:hypothetical protein BDN72DRAFT_394267 [Pluteus cervinus]|uniref:Uncharacterized protein n=1 Tax=Pluteus cervinus TaxID=181527 RepID=A0ACD3B2W7_9AGAR|nr:hypothetical protein BDN72DRAFT_394267 [Pluteus cervinus]